MEIENKAKLAENMKVLLHEENNEIFDRLDFNNDNIFLEPLLFNYFNTGIDERKYKLDQILFSYLLEEKEVLIYFDSMGNSYIPNLGYVKSNKKNGHFRVSIEDKE